MPYDYTINSTSRLVWLRRTGEADVAGWRETMLRLIGDPAFADGMPILFDVRHSNSNPPPGQGRLLAAMWRDLVPNSRVAVVAATPLTFNVAKRLETNTGGHVRAFDNLDEARDWLVGVRPRDS